jgi:wyosine [tRNA(Phe)-imidazoG37] synthetase (radical SAM superfamily)
MNSNDNLYLFLDPANRRAFSLHDRHWRNNRYVYPVVSRRSGGISIGVNLNPDKICNLDCIYCSVDRKIPGGSSNVDPQQVRGELSAMLQLVTGGGIYTHEPFNAIAPELRRLNDIAFSGDGEPTTCPEFGPCCRIAADLLQHSALSDVKIVVITNATMFHRPDVRDALAFLDQNNGEIWAKLDAGTQSYYQLVDRTSIPLSRVLENITSCARLRPTVIQSLFLRVHNQPPPESEIAAYAQRLNQILADGGKIKLVQLYTVARQTTEPYATALRPEELQTIQKQVAAALPGIPLQIYL